MQGLLDECFFFMDLWYTWDFMGFEYVDATLDILNLYIYIYIHTPMYLNSSQISKFGDVLII